MERNCFWPDYFINLDITKRFLKISINSKSSSGSSQKQKQKQVN